MMVIWFVLLFIISQVIIEKNILPKRILQLGLLQMMILSFLIILMSIIIGILLNQSILLVGSVTIFCSSIIAWKYRSKFENREV